jgi:RNA polymerase sigma-70 factor (ECF subfamily)
LSKVRTGDDERAGSAGPSYVGPESELSVLERGLERELEREEVAGAASVLAQVDDLARTYGGDIYRRCRRILGTDQDAYDASQVVFLQAFEKLDGGGVIENPLGWLRTVARNRCLDWIRSDRFVPVEDAELDRAREPEAFGFGDLMTADPFLSRELDGCLDGQDDRTRKVVLLRFQEDLSYEEISAEVKDRPGALRVRVARALVALRRCLRLKGVMS